MRPLLASLALLLLALCRPIDSQNPKDVIMAIVPDAQKPAVEAKLGDIWTLFAVVLSSMDPSKPVPAPMKKIIDNGVLCALEDTTLAATLKTAMYGTGGRAPAEEQLATELVSKGFDFHCGTEATTPEYVCYCTDKNPVFYCAALKYKATKLQSSTKGKCKKEALAELKTAAPTFGPNFDYAEMAKLLADSDKLAALNAAFMTEESSIDQMITKTPEATKFFCDAKKPDVEAKVKALFASDPSFGTIDELVIKKAFDQKDIQEVGEACQNDAEFKSSPFGSCACEGDRGYLFCIYKVLADSFPKEFLDCAANKFVDDKKPTAPPMKPKPKPTTAAVPVVPAAGNDTVATTAAPSDSTATSSLLVPLAAAAAMLLRH